MKKYSSAERAIKMIALREGISENEVREEIEKAIEAAMNNSDPEIKKKWNTLSRDRKNPTAEELISKIASRIIK